MRRLRPLYEQGPNEPPAAPSDAALPEPIPDDQLPPGPDAATPQPEAPTPAPSRILIPKEKDDDNTPMYRAYKTTIAVGPGLRPHDHDAKLDQNGDGVAKANEGHIHIVAGFDCKPMRGHNHKLIDPETRKTIQMKGTAYKSGTDAKTGEKAPIAPPQQTVAQGGGGGPGAGLPGTFQSGEASIQNMWADWTQPQLVEWSEIDQIAAKYAILHRVVQEGDRVLDVGCGRGSLYEWLTQEFRRPIGYYGLDNRTELVQEFVTRFPETSNRVMMVESLDAAAAEALMNEHRHFQVATLFGMPATIPNNDSKYDRLRQILAFMGALSETVVIECLDSAFHRPQAENDERTAWSAGLIQEAFGSQWKTFLIRPLTEGDFAVVAYRKDIL